MWVLDIDYNMLAQTVLLYLANKPENLTGNEIRFIRYYFDVTLRDFAHRLGIKHPTVIKWEKNKDRRADVTWGIEKDIRLFILDRLCKSNKEFRQSYKNLEKVYNKIESLSSESIKHSPQFHVHEGFLEKAG